MVHSEHDLIGRQLLVCFRTIHVDRAGETAVEILKQGEIVAMDASGWLVIDTAGGEHLRCPATKIHPAPAMDSAITLTTEDRRAMTLLGRPHQPDFIAAEELIRDFHSATRPVTLKWLDREESQEFFLGLHSRQKSGEVDPD